MNTTPNLPPNFARCIRNDGYPASLEVGTWYQMLPDPTAADSDFVHIVDESGEDYLYPADYFTLREHPDMCHEQ